MDPPSHTAPWTLHHQATQHLQNIQLQIGDSGPLHHQAHSIYKTVTHKLAIEDLSFIRSRSVYETANHKLAIVDPSIIRSHSAYKTGAPLHHQVTQHLRRLRIPDIQHFRRFQILPTKNLPIRPIGCVVSQRDVNSHPVPSGTDDV